MKLTLLNTGKTDVSYLQTGISDYAKRISHLIDFSVKDVPVKKISRNESPQQLCIREGEIIKKHIAGFDRIVLLDERGREFGSRDFAGWIQQQMNQGIRQMAFITGGAWGFSDELYKLADFKLSLSKMTLTHQMVRLLFTEQLYRAMTLINGIPYHND